MYICVNKTDESTVAEGPVFGRDSVSDVLIQQNASVNFANLNANSNDPDYWYVFRLPDNHSDSLRIKNGDEYGFNWNGANIPANSIDSLDFSTEDSKRYVVFSLVDTGPGHDEWFANNTDTILIRVQVFLPDQVTLDPSVHNIAKYLTFKHPLGKAKLRVVFSYGESIIEIKTQFPGEYKFPDTTVRYPNFRFANNGFTIDALMPQE